MLEARRPSIERAAEQPDAADERRNGWAPLATHCGVGVTENNTGDGMTSQFDNFMDIIVTQYAERGEGTGGASKILSGLVFPILTVLAVQLVKDQQYIPLLVLAALMWTKIGFFVMLAGLIYFLMTRYWMGAGILAGYFIVTSLSVYFGKRNIKRLFLSGKPMVSPFEGMPDLLLILVFECLFLALALFTHGWVRAILGSLFVIVVLHHFGRYWFRMRPRWSQIHQPLMMRYAACAGQEAGQAEREKRAFDFHAATKSLLKSVYPQRQDEDIETMVYDASEKMDTFSDRDLIRHAIQRRNLAIPKETVEGVLDKTEVHLRSDEGRKLIVRYTVAKVVESVFGESERGEYLLAVIEGKAN